MSRSIETLYRQWLMLAKIPRYPRKVGTQALKSVLAGHGYEVNVRTIQRDLDKLSSYFPLNFETRGRTNYWFWIEDAPVLELPGMETCTAVAFNLAQAWLTPLLPEATLELLAPYFKQAETILDGESQSQLRKWPEKVAHIERGPMLAPPSIAPQVQRTIYEAPSRERQLAAEYRRRNKQDVVQFRLNPLGLVIRQGIIYLVCSRENDDKKMHLALHRFNSARLLPEQSTVPIDFSLTDYVNEQYFAYPLTELPITLKVLFDKDTVQHLIEAPLSEDQTLQRARDGRFLLCATVRDTHELRWWLQGFGAKAEALEPAEMRRHFAEAARQMRAYYDENEGSSGKRFAVI